MTHPLSNGDSLLLVGVPKDATDFELICKDKKYVRYIHDKWVDYIKLNEIGTLTNVEILGQFSPRESSIDFEVKEEWCASPCKPKYQGYCEDVCQGDCNQNWDYENEFINVLTHLCDQQWPEKENPYGASEDKYISENIKWFYNEEIMADDSNESLLSNKWHSAQLKAMPEKVLVLLIKK